MSNETVAVIASRLDALQAQVAKLSEIIEKLAIQEEKMVSLSARVARMEAEHTRCQSACRIDEVVTDIRWFRWFTGASCAATFSMLTAIIVHYVKGGIA